MQETSTSHQAMAKDAVRKCRAKLTLADALRYFAHLQERLK
jgi:hypothetical protein